MRKKITMIASLAMLTAVALPSSTMAQSQNEGDEQIAEVIKSYHDGRYLDARKAELYVVNKKRNFAVAVGGSIRGEFGMDFNGYIENSFNNGFIVSKIPYSYYKKSRSQFLGTANSSTLYVKVAGVTKCGHDIMGFVSTNFVTLGNYPILREAYVKAFGFTVGQAWNLMADINAYPITIDYWSPCGVTGFRNPVIRYENTLGFESQWGYGAEIGLPNVNAQYDNKYESPIVQAVPNFSAYFEFKWGQNHGSKVRIAGLYRRMSYYDNVLSETTGHDGWGAQLGGYISITSRLKFLYRATVGEGIASYINDLSTLPLDLLPNIEKAGQMSTLPMYGYYAGLQYNVSDKITTSATFSQCGIQTVNSIASSVKDYKSSAYAVVNGFYNFSDRLQCGVEVLYGRKTFYDLRTTNAFRFNTLVQFKF